MSFRTFCPGASAFPPGPSYGTKILWRVTAFSLSALRARRSPPTSLPPSRGPWPWLKRDHELELFGQFYGPMVVRFDVQIENRTDRNMKFSLHATGVVSGESGFLKGRWPRWWEYFDLQRCCRAAALNYISESAWRQGR